MLTWAALTPGDASAQWLRHDPPAMGDLPASDAVAIETVIARAWDDNSGDLPGISNGKAVLIVAGALAVGALAYIALRSDNEDEDEDDGGNRASLLLDLEEPTMMSPTLRWRVGVAWAF